MAVQKRREIFQNLDDPDSYDPFTFDYLENGQVPLSQWIEVFRKSVPGFKRQALTVESSNPSETLKAAESFETIFNAVLDKLLEDPQADIGLDTGYDTVNCAMLCRARDLCLKRAGFGDIFLRVKEEENDRALNFLPDLIKEFDAIDDPCGRMELAVQGVFAGNIFDLGAAESERLFENSRPVFQETRLGLQRRPWVIDNLTVMMERFRGQAHGKAVIFVDNAGCDIVLGVLPLARELLRRGTAVVLAANEEPTINDITCHELKELMPRVAEIDPHILGRCWASGELSVVSSGSSLPVLDLRDVSAELCDAARGAELVILVGMGRSIETNLRARFRCDVACLGMIKHPEVAALLGGPLYGCVCRFELCGQANLDWSNLNIEPERSGDPYGVKAEISVAWPPNRHQCLERFGKDLLGECPVWDADSGTLYWVDIAYPTIHRLRVATGEQSLVKVNDLVGSIGLWGADKPGGHEIVATVGRQLVGVSFPDGVNLGRAPMAETEPLVEIIPEALACDLCFNDGKPDANGNFWVGTAPRPGSELAARASPYREVQGGGIPGVMEVDPEGTPPPARLHCVRRSATGGLEVTEVKEVGPVTVSNGLGWSPDNRTMYYTDSAARCVRAFDFDPDTCQLSGGRVYCGVPQCLPASSVPDGLTVSSDGDVWVAFWNGGAVGRFRNGRLLSLIRLPVSRPTSVAFGGPMLDTLYVTSCSRDKAETEILPEPHAGCLFAVRGLNATGFPANCFSGP
uniref:Gluconolactonase n=1 Tax=Tetraselmis sp. GSL018 TaxID=582737 RepID=A0A061SEX1_9CHLO|mmetsp:Transcript_35060/g.83181  ORF Transcript_35060/g.83181 Transcript_35060/m.83181 type:complete len:745 (+) Transcript_35060:242-2476(+)